MLLEKLVEAKWLPEVCATIEHAQISYNMTGWLCAHWRRGQSSTVSAGQCTRDQCSCRCCVAQVVGRPNDVAAAEATLARLQERQQGAEGGMGHSARFGAPDQAMTKAITKCLQVSRNASNRSQVLDSMLKRSLHCSACAG